MYGADIDDSVIDYDYRHQVLAVVKIRVVYYRISVTLKKRLEKGLFTTLVPTPIRPSGRELQSK